MRLQRWLCVFAAPVLMVGVLATRAEAAVVISRAELSGSKLRVEGSGALPNHSISVTPGPVTGTTDGSGAFRIESLTYSSPTCQITVSDGATSASATLSGCTPQSPPPPPGTAPIATIAPTSLTFAAQNTGTTSTAKTVTLTNTGNAPLTISGAALGGANAADY